MNCNACQSPLQEGDRILVMAPAEFNSPPQLKGLGIRCEQCVDQGNRRVPKGKEVIKPNATVIAGGLGLIKDDKQEPETWQEWTNRHWEHYGHKETAITMRRDNPGADVRSLQPPEVG